MSASDMSRERALATLGELARNLAMMVEAYVPKIRGTELQPDDYAWLLQVKQNVETALQTHPQEPPNLSY